MRKLTINAFVLLLLTGPVSAATNLQTSKTFRTGTAGPRIISNGIAPMISVGRLTPLLPASSVPVLPNSKSPANAMAIIQNGVTLPQTVLPVPIVENSADRPAVASFHTLQTLDAGLIHEAAKDGGTELALNEKLAESFDGRTAPKKTAEGTIVANGSGQSPRARLTKYVPSLAAVLLSVPAFSAPVQAVTHSDHSMSPAAIWLIMTALALALFTGAVQVFKVKVMKRQQMLPPSLKARDAAVRLTNQLKGITGRTYVTVEKLSTGETKLVVYFTDKAGMKAPMPEAFEGMVIRRKLVTLTDLDYIITRDLFGAMLRS